jgi:hypothetical protein
MPLADDQNAIQALTAKRFDQAFSVWGFATATSVNGSVTNPHRSSSALEGLPVGTIIVARQIGGRRGHRKPQQLPPSHWMML